MSRSIFLSHSHTDKDIARQIFYELRADGYRCWLDEAEIKPGDSIIAKVESAIDGTDYVGVVLTPHSVTSPWVLSELRMALTDEILKHKIRVIGLVARDCELPGFLRDKLYIDFRQSFGTAIDQLKAALSGTLATIVLPPQAKLARFIHEQDPRGQKNVNLSDLVRRFSTVEFECLLLMLEEWGGAYKLWDSYFANLVRRVSNDDDKNAAKLVVRTLCDFGVIEAADDIDYPTHAGWAYCRTERFHTLRDICQRAKRAGVM